MALPINPTTIGLSLPADCWVSIASNLEYSELRSFRGICKDTRTAVSRIMRQNFVTQFSDRTQAYFDIYKLKHLYKFAYLGSEGRSEIRKIKINIENFSYEQFLDTLRLLKDCINLISLNWQIEIKIEDEQKFDQLIRNSESYFIELPRLRKLTVEWPVVFIKAPLAQVIITANNIGQVITTLGLFRPNTNNLEIDPVAFLKSPFINYIETKHFDNLRNIVRLNIHSDICIRELKFDNEHFSKLKKLTVSNILNEQLKQLSELNDLNFLSITYDDFYKLSEDDIANFIARKPDCQLFINSLSELIKVANEF